MVRPCAGLLGLVGVFGPFFANSVQLDVVQPVADSQQPPPSGWVPRLLQRATGWNGAVVAKLIGGLAPRAAHPFVVEITDENYDQVIPSHPDLFRPGWGSDEETVWVVAVLAADRPSSLLDAEFKKLAANSSLAAHVPLPEAREDAVQVSPRAPDDPFLFKPAIRFGTIDYMAKTDLILTRWLIFKCPVLVVITKKGAELRFFKTGVTPPTAEHLAQFLREGRWIHKPAWNSTFSPTGSGAWFVNGSAHLFQGFHALTDKVPGWVLMILSSMLGTSLMQWLHRREPVNPPRSGRTRAGERLKTASVASGQTLKEELARAAVQLAGQTKKKSPHTQVVDSPEGDEPDGMASTSGSGMVSQVSTKPSGSPLCQRKTAKG